MPDAVSRSAILLSAFRSKFPTPSQIMLPFALCEVLIHSWANLHFFHELPALLLRATNWEFIGVMAYVEASALMETLLVMLSVVFLGILLPKRFFANRFASSAGSLVLLVIFWAVLLNLNPWAIRWWSLMMNVAMLALFIFSIVIVLLAINRSDRISSLLVRVMDRFVPLAMIFLLIDLLSIGVVGVRNAF